MLGRMVSNDAIGTNIASSTPAATTCQPADQPEAATHPALEQPQALAPAASAAASEPGSRGSLFGGMWAGGADIDAMLVRVTTYSQQTRHVQLDMVPSCPCMLRTVIVSSGCDHCCVFERLACGSVNCTLLCRI